MGCEFSKLYNLEIHLENDLGIFEPADVVAGHVLIQVENDTSIHHCFLTLRGLAYFASTNASAQQRTSNESEVVEEFQVLLSRTEDLLSEYKVNDHPYGSGAEARDPGYSPEFIITKGLHVLNFEFQLPAHVPASFVVPEMAEADGIRAFVVYNIKVELVNVSHHVSHSRQRDILVVRALDLTQYPRLQDKITLKKEFVMTGCCASARQMQCELTVNKCAFVPGEILTVDLLVNNGSTKAVETVRLSLFQNITTKSGKILRSVRLKLFSLAMGSVSPHEAETFKESIHIPPVVASGLFGCDIIDVTYSLIAQLIVFGNKPKGDDLVLKIPMTIGSDPVKDASFGDIKEVVPCYASFDYESGSVIEYVPMKATSSVHRMLPVYRYYKPRPNKLIPFLQRNFAFLSQNTIPEDPISVLDCSLSSVKLSNEIHSTPILSNQIKSNQIMSIQDPSNKVSTNETIFDHKLSIGSSDSSQGAVCQFNYLDRAQDVQKPKLRDCLGMQIIPTNNISSFHYYLSEESSDVTESFW